MTRKNCTIYIYMLMMHAVAAANNINVKRGTTGLSPNEVHIGKHTTLPMTIILERRGVRGYEGLSQDQLDFLKIMRRKKK